MLLTSPKTCSQKLTIGRGTRAACSAACEEIPGENVRIEEAVAVRSTVGWFDLPLIYTRSTANKTGSRRRLACGPSLEGEW